MMTNVLTLVAAETGPVLTAEAVETVKAALDKAGATTGEVAWLAPERASDIPFSGLAPKPAEIAARHALGGAAIDVVAQEAAGRRKSLLIADMDSTIVTSETLDELADFVGLKDRVSEITRRAMNGEIDFKGALRERVGMLAGLSADALEETFQRVVLTAGADALARTMRKHGAYCALVSGGFTFFTGRVATLAGFDEHRGNTLEIAKGKLTGKVGEPILDRDSKLATLTELARLRGLSLADTMAVGDGANDLPMIQASGMGVAFHAKPITAEGARARVDHAGLEALLYLQGYRRDQFVVERP
jgi:phosphoserine phosphatase